MNDALTVSAVVAVTLLSLIFLTLIYPAGMRRLFTAGGILRLLAWIAGLAITAALVAFIIVQP